ncbi:MAG TPA: fibronectin type III domain-containing protein, partial [Verrucomicrobiae bacterium]|nr:fibronectin type III domain-containing protein [Verrucomicrobiae bacterium]
NAQGSSVSFSGWQALGRDTHSLTVNPQLVNGAAGNLMLQTNSPAAGVGVNLSSYFTYDMAGNTRPSGGNWDLGAYQYSSTGISVPPTTNYTITASAGTGGSISPSGFVLVNAGNSQTFTVTASSGDQIANVTVDGTNIGAVSSYSFSNVTTSHTISASFVSTGTTPPSAPANLSASPVSPSEIDLSWAASTAGTYPIAGYHIYVNGAATPTASATTTSYRSIGLSASTTSSYAVSAYDTAGNEGQRTTVSATTWPPLSTKFILGEHVSIITGPANVRQQPTNRLAGAVIGQQPANAVATVVGGPVYAAVNGVYYYWWNLSFSTSPSGWVAEDNLQLYSSSIVVPPSPSVITKTITANITNAITLQFATNLASSTWQTIGTYAGSTTLTFTNMPAVFIRGICSNLTSSVTLTWPPSTDPILLGYIIYYGTASQTYNNAVTVGKVTTATISNLTAGKTYYFQVMAYDSRGILSLMLNNVSAVPQAMSFSLTFTGH